MLQDLEKGRKTEIDSINGFVVDRGREAAVPTPFNPLIVELIHAAKARKGVTDGCLSSAAMKTLVAENPLSVLSLARLRPVR
jgi:hypothetical protein